MVDMKVSMNSLLNGFSKKNLISFFFKIVSFSYLWSLVPFAVFPNLYYHYFASIPTIATFVNLFFFSLSHLSYNSSLFIIEVKGKLGKSVSHSMIQ